MKKLLLLLSISIFCCSACQSPAKKEEKPALETYRNTLLGWTITVPNGFSILSKNRMEANEAKGRAAIGADSTASAPTDELQHLVNFQKNQFNLFSATAQKFSGSSKTYQQNYQLAKKLIFEAYAKQQIKIDTSSGKANFASRSFLAFYIKIYGPNGSVVMDQALYSALIKGYDLSVNINYNNEVDHALLLDAFKQSTFAKSEN